MIRTMMILVVVLSQGLVRQTREDEPFYDFLIKFSLYPDFQKQRIKFPFQFVTLSEDYTRKVIKNISPRTWKQISFFTEKQSYLTDIEERFDNKVNNSDERVFKLMGIENGIQVKYYFKRIQGKWYLIKVEDFST